MALFENFPYSDLHQLNLDWVIDELNRIKESAVLSVNGQTGDVILYENATVQFPAVPEDHWSIIKMANGTYRGIMFGNDDKAYIVHGNLMNEVYAQNNQPPYPVTSVNGQTGDIILYAQNTVRLPDLDDITLHNWNIFRELNNVFRGIQFNDDGTAEIIDGLNRYQLYSANNTPPYPVTSVNGQTGDIALFTDNNGAVAFPAITDPNITGWILGRNINNTPCYIQLNDDGTMTLTAGSNTYSVYTSYDTASDIIDIPTQAVTDNWGLIRTTSEGSVGILFSNNDQLVMPEAYIRYVDLMNVVHTEKLLTSADIPSTAGVVSFNGQTGVVVVRGSDLIVSITDTRTIAQAIADTATNDTKIKESLAYVEDTNTASQNIPDSAYVIWKGNPYKSTTAISIGTTLSGSNLTAISTGGITNDLEDIVDTLSSTINNYVTGPNSSTDGTIPLFDGTTGKKIKAGYSVTDSSSSTAMPNTTNIPTDRAVRNSFYNGLDKTATGFALDARSGKTLNDKITTLGYNTNALRSKSTDTNSVMIRSVNNTLEITAFFGNSTTYISLAISTSGCSAYYVVNGATSKSHQLFTW